MKNLQNSNYEGTRSKVLHRNYKNIFLYWRLSNGCNLWDYTSEEMKKKNDLILFILPVFLLLFFFFSSYKMFDSKMHIKISFQKWKLWSPSQFLTIDLLHDLMESYLNVQWCQTTITTNQHHKMKVSHTPFKLVNDMCPQVSYVVQKQKSQL